MHLRICTKQKGYNYLIAYSGLTKTQQRIQPEDRLKFCGRWNRLEQNCTEFVKGGTGG